MTFADDLLKEAGNEPIVGVVIGADRRTGSRIFAPDIARQGELLTWKEAQPLLDYDYDYNIGWLIADCHAVYAWTTNRVLFLVKYDDDTWIKSAPRNPLAIMPEVYGYGS